MTKIFNETPGYALTKNTDGGSPYRHLTLRDRRWVMDAKITGCGGFGYFYVAYEPAADRFAAVKVVHMPADDHLPGQPPGMVAALRPDSKERIHRSDLDQIDAEIGGLRAMRPKLFLGDGAYIGKRTKKYVFVQELMNGTLASHMERLQAHVGGAIADRATEAQKSGASALLRHLVYGLAKDLSALHSRGYTHNDLKRDNVFLRFIDDKTPPEFLVWDFGLLTQRNRSGCCNIYTASPEVARGALPTSKNDIWCLGLMVMNIAYSDVLPNIFAQNRDALGSADDPRARCMAAFEALRCDPTAACPGIDSAWVETMRAAWQRVRALPKPLPDLVSKMLHANPRLRPTAKEVAKALMGIVHVGPAGRQDILAFWHEARGYHGKVKDTASSLRARFQRP